MIATDFERDYCKLNGKRISYAKLQREYCCAECGRRLVLILLRGRWIVRCGRCLSQDFMHEYEYERQQHEAAEVLDGLEQDYRDEQQQARRPF